MSTELEVLRIVSERLGREAIPFMLTGSYAMAYYATPRMTRDLDLVVALQPADVPRLLEAFAADFYLDADAAREAVQTERMFNMMHLASGIKLDMIVKKSTPYRDLEFSRRVSGLIGDVPTWLVSREDLILSKLVWARDSGSELQVRDVRALLVDTVDIYDTTPEFSRLVAERHMGMTPEERLRAAADMFETARAIVESSLPAGLTTYERRLALIRRIYGSELPPAAQEAYARHGGESRAR